MTDITKKRLYLILVTIGLVLVFGGMIWDMLSDWTDVLPKNDWDRALMILGMPITIIGLYFRPNPPETNTAYNGCLWILMCLLAVLWVDDINHYSTPIIVILAIAGVLAVPAIILSCKRWKDARASLNNEEEDKKQD